LTETKNRWFLWLHHIRAHRRTFGLDSNPALSAEIDAAIVGDAEQPLLQRATVILPKITASMAGVRVVNPREIKAFPYFMEWHPWPPTELARAWFREQLRLVTRTI
jgi:hypothetical protein